MQKLPQQRFLVQIKDGDPGVADRLVAYLNSHQAGSLERFAFFGSAAPVLRLHELLPAAQAWTARSVRQCGTGYLATGWLGKVPGVCDGGMIIVPVDQAYLMWGWPNRFLARMRTHRTEVMLIGRIDSLWTRQFSRLDSVQELSRVPAGFDGSIWTDQIRVIVPAVHTAAAAN